MISDSSTTLKTMMGIAYFSGPIFPLNGYPPVFSSDVSNNPESVMADIRYKTTQLYEEKIKKLLCKERIEQLTTPEVIFPLALRQEMLQLPDPALSYVGLPALFAEGILIRPPLPSEGNKIWPKLHVEDRVEEEDFFSYVKNEGYFLQGKVLNRVLIAEDQDNNKKIDGAIHFQINFEPQETSCYIYSLKTRKNSRSNGIGKLLLSHAILTAMQEGAKKIFLESSPAGIPLYTLFGFVPDVDDVKLKDWWDKSTISEKMCVNRAYSKFNLEADLRLDLTEKNLNILVERIDNIFNPTIKTYYDYKNTKIPQEAIDNGLIDKNSLGNKDKDIIMVDADQPN